MGARPEGTTLDRERVNDNYQPDNCSWATGIEQGRNRRDNRYLDHNGKRQTIAEWARELGVGRMRIQSRLNMGWSIQQALELPKGARP
jgi:hypothetical protein